MGDGLKVQQAQAPPREGAALPISLQPGKLEDLPALVTLMAACIARMREENIEQWDEIYPSAANIEADIRAATLHVLRVGGEIAGTVTLDATQDPLWRDMDWQPVAGPVAAVHRVMVHPAQQGRGFSKQLMLHAESLARAQGFQAIHLDAFIRNPIALALYDRPGAAPTNDCFVLAHNIFSKQMKGPLRIVAVPMRR